MTAVSHDVQTPHDVVCKLLTNYSVECKNCGIKEDSAIVDRLKVCVTNINSLLCYVYIY